LLYQTELIAGY